MDGTLDEREIINTELKTEATYCQRGLRPLQIWKIMTNFVMCFSFQIFPLLLPLAKSPLTEVGGAVASCWARSSLDRALLVRALAGDIMVCSWARHFLPSHNAFSPSRWINGGTGKLNSGGYLSSHSGKPSRNTASCFRATKTGISSDLISSDLVSRIYPYPRSSNRR